MSKTLAFREFARFQDFGLSLVFSDYQDLPEEPAHSHDFNELVLVTHGRGTHLFNGERFEIHSGNVFLVTPGQSHAYASIDHLELYSFLFFEPMIEPFRRELERLSGFQLLFHLEPNMSLPTRMTGNLYLPPDVLQEAITLAREMRRLLQERPPGSRLRVWSAFLQLLTMISLHCRARSRSNNVHYLHADTLSRVLSYIEQNLTGELTLELLARQSCMSVSNFRRLFSATLHKPPMRYVLELRLDKAAALLDGSDLTVMEVAWRSGFHDSNYFSHQFRRRFGCSPLQYRAHKTNLSR